MDYQDINAKTIDRWVNEGWEWGKPLDHETYERATKGDWQVLATPTKAVPQEWLGDLRGRRLLLQPLRPIYQCKSCEYRVAGRIARPCN